MLDGILDDILGDSPKRGEIRPDSPTVRPAQSLDIPELSPLSPLSPDLPGEDRHYCRECLNLNSSRYCTAQRFRPVDDIPRRCEYYNGYDDVLNVGYAIGEKSDAPAPEPDGDRTSEAAHNAQGRFFKFLITRPDGSQFYSCAMPRQTLSEVRAQYPDATHIQPVEGEDYPND
jgi:hypothetical protein